MLLPLPPRQGEGGRRQRRAFLVPQLFVLLLLLFAVERLLLLLPPDLGERCAIAIAQLRLYGDDALWRPWQLWSGPLLLHDWWQLLLALPVWLLWAPGLERRLGTLRLALLLAVLLPVTALLCLYPQPLQPVSLLAGGQHLFLGMSLIVWGGERCDMLLLKPGLRSLELRRLRLSIFVPVIIIEVLDLLRVLLMDGMLYWPLPLLVVAQLVVSLALGMAGVQLVLSRTQHGQALRS